MTSMGAFGIEEDVLEAADSGAIHLDASNGQPHDAVVIRAAHVGVHSSSGGE